MRTSKKTFAGRPEPAENSLVRQTPRRTRAIRSVAKSACRYTARPARQIVSAYVGDEHVASVEGRVARHAKLRVAAPTRNPCRGTSGLSWALSGYWHASQSGSSSLQAGVIAASTVLRRTSMSLDVLRFFIHLGWMPKRLTSSVDFSICVAASVRR